MHAAFHVPRDRRAIAESYAAGLTSHHSYHIACSTPAYIAGCRPLLNGGRFVDVRRGEPWQMPRQGHGGRVRLTCLSGGGTGNERVFELQDELQLTES